jgi:hypothetical protein
MRYKKLRKIDSKEKYFNGFNNSGDKTFADALEKALDIRKFEIELYWRRAAYFWAFIALSFTLYFIVFTSDKIAGQLKNEAELLATFLGLFLSISWFLVNKGSKYWQENWEKQVDLLEEKVYGSLYKTTIHKKNKWDRFHPLKSYTYSVGKINQLLSFTIVLVWLMLLFKTINQIFSFYEPCKYFNIYVIGIVFITLIIILICGTITSSNTCEEIIMKRREIIDEEST